MLRKTTLLVAAFAVAGLASLDAVAKPAGQAVPIVVGSTAASPDGTPTLTFTVNIANNSSTTQCPAFNAQPAVGEPVIPLNVGANAVVTGIGWSTTQTAFAPSWLSELTVGFYSNAGLQITLAPGFGQDVPGGPTAFTSNGVIDLSDNNLPNIAIGADGLLRLGICESFLDGANPDGTFNPPSTITIACFNCVDPTGAPALTITPPTGAAFGNQNLGTTSNAQTVTLSNTGTAPVQITGIDAANAPFARVGGSCAATPFTLSSGGGSCTLQYTFAPTVLGPASQTIAVTTATPGLSGSFGLTGNGVVPQVVPANQVWALLALAGLVGLAGALLLRRHRA
jgi:hypothetical protein